MTTQPATTSRDAVARLNDIQDQPGEGWPTSVHVPHEVAKQFLINRGWTIKVGERHGAFESATAPDGHRYWHLDEAMVLAILMETP
jgi:hypothetical protein